MGEQGIAGHQGAGAEEIILGRGEGERTYKIVEQGIGRIEKRVRAIMAVFVEADTSEDAAGLDPSTIHDALTAFIPDLAPEWELRGLRSEDALERLNAGDELTEDDYTNSDPSIPQLMNAVEAIYRVNGGDRLVRLLGKFVEPEMLRARIRYELQTRGTKTATQDSDGSPSSPPQNGGSAQTPSGMSDPDPFPISP